MLLLTTVERSWDRWGRDVKGEWVGGGEGIFYFQALFVGSLRKEESYKWNQLLWLNNFGRVLLNIMLYLCYLK